MCFQRTPLSLWWSGIYKSKAMVDYSVQLSSLDGWLDQVTLFPSEPDDFFNFNELLSSEKANNEVALDTELSDLNWLDENVNLSLLDNPKELQFLPNELETSLLQDAVTYFMDSLDSDLDPSYLSSKDPKDGLDSVLDTSVQDLIYSAPSPTVTYSDSPYYESISAASSPASSASSITQEQVTSDEYCPSPAGSSDSGFDAPSVVSVTVCKSSFDLPSVEKTYSIDELADSVKRKRFVNDGNTIPKVPVSLKNAFHPYAKAPPKRKTERFERKKVQNKEAAARYRIKKRIEEKEISVEVSGLEKEQKELQKKHDALAGEIKYLKTLMCEILQKKGVLK